MTSRDTSGEDLAELSAGSAAFATEQPFDWTASRMWQDGWLSAAHAAAVTMSEHRHLIDKAHDLLSDMRVLARTVQSTPKASFSDRERANRVLHLVDRVQPTKGYRQGVR